MNFPQGYLVSQPDRFTQLNRSGASENLYLARIRIIEQRGYIVTRIELKTTRIHLT